MNISDIKNYDDLLQRLRTDEIFLDKFILDFENQAKTIPHIDWFMNMLTILTKLPEADRKLIDALNNIAKYATSNRM